MASVSVSSEDKLWIQVAKVREEIGKRFSEAHQVLVDREAELLSELKQLEERYRGKGIPEQIEELNQLKEVQLATAKINKNKSSVMRHVSELDARVKKIRGDWEKEKASMKRVELKWNTELETSFTKIGGIAVSAVRDYMGLKSPVKVGGKHWNKVSLSDRAWNYSNTNNHSIAIDSETDNLFVCDTGSNISSVQVFNKSLEFLFDFSEKMKAPEGICIHDRLIYITDDDSLNLYNTNGKLLKSVGKKGNKKLEFDSPSGVAVCKK